MSPETNLRLSIAALSVYPIEPAIIQDMLRLLDKIENKPCQHPWRSVVGDGKMQTAKCLKCNEIL